MSTIPPEAAAFLAQTEWADGQPAALAGDASFRRYYRITKPSGDTAMLMHAPPPHEDVRPFLSVGGWLLEHGFRAPAILASDVEQGFILLEDFGDARIREHLEEGGGDAESSIYARAVDTLAALHKVQPGPFPPYDLDTYMREVDLFIEWYCPAAGIDVDGDGWSQAWREVLTPLLERQQPGVTVLRDYHAENIMLLPGGEQGLIDFQDALVGHRAYDLVSLLQDARRDVSEELERAMFDRYVAAANPGPEFAADYGRLGAQRNVKIVGIFARLNRRDHKPRYLAMIPRVWRAMERDLAHAALAPVKRWFTQNIPDHLRDNEGGELQ